MCQNMSKNWFLRFKVKIGGFQGQILVLGSKFWFLS